MNTITALDDEFRSRLQRLMSKWLRTVTDGMPFLTVHDVLALFDVHDVMASVT
jgi:hypothetical protein